MSHHHDIYCDSDTPYSFTYHVYKSKLYFLSKAMMMIFCFLVKIIATHIHKHTHTNIYIKKLTKNFLLGQSVATLATHSTSYIQETSSNLPRGACFFIHTHTKYHLYVQTQHYENIMIIIMSCHSHGYPWSSLATSLYPSSPLAGLQGYITYPHIAAECMFELVVLPLPGHMRGSIGVHHLWARPCFSSSVLHVWFVWLV